MSQKWKNILFTHGEELALCHCVSSVGFGVLSYSLVKRVCVPSLWPGDNGRDVLVQVWKGNGTTGLPGVKILRCFLLAWTIAKPGGEMHMAFTLRDRDDPNDLDLLKSISPDSTSKWAVQYSPALLSCLAPGTVNRNPALTVARQCRGSINMRDHLATGNSNPLLVA